MDNFVFGAATMEAAIERLKTYRAPLKNKLAYSEVATPPPLVEKILDALEAANRGVWKDPAAKILDPCAGKGVFPILAYKRLMEGLSSAIPDPVARDKHIRQEMLYATDINPDMARAGRALLPNYLNWDFLAGAPPGFPSQFDVILCNPPFHASNSQRGSKVVYDAFVHRCLDVLKRNGLGAFVHLPGWRKASNPGSKLHRLFEKVAHERRLLRLDMSDQDDTFVTAHPAYDWYVVRNSPMRGKTTVNDWKGESHQVDMAEWDFLPHFAFQEIHGLLALKRKAQEVLQTPSYPVAKCVKERTSTNTIPVVNNVRENGPELLYARPHEDGRHLYKRRKVIISESMPRFSFYDEDGSYSLTTNTFAIPVVDEKDAGELGRFLRSPLFARIRRACQWSGFRMEPAFVAKLRAGFWRAT